MRFVVDMWLKRHSFKVISVSPAIPRFLRQPRTVRDMFAVLAARTQAQAHCLATLQF